VREDKLVRAQARRELLAYVRYVSEDAELPPWLLRGVARRLYIAGEVSIETFERYLALEFGLPTVR
jgi:hypothetical protein